MSRFLPRTLFGQTLVILLAGLVLSQVVGAWIYLGARREAVRAIGGLAVAQRVANLTHLIEEAPADWRPRIVAASSDPSFRLVLATTPVVAAADGEPSPAGETIAAFLKDELAVTGERGVRVALRAADQVASQPSRGPGMGPGFGQGFGPGGHGQGFGRGMMRGQLMHAAGSWRGIDIAVPLRDGRWLNVSTALPELGPSLSPQLIVALLAMAAIVALVATLAVRRLVAPLASLAGAAERIGRDVAAAPLAETGTVEMRQAAHALNQMQERLRRLIENRTEMLAAISHDLRTELQLLRLRAETMDPPEERDRLLATVANMEEMVRATLAFARDEARIEPVRRTDVAALLASIVDDMADAGRPVRFEAPAAPTILEVQPSALRRALTNLIDNAVNYGERARVSIATAADGIAITIDDDGPGIPEDELGRVTQPFYRLERSRNRASGGMGLGLAITQAAIQAHGGRLTLANRPGGGLRATVTLDDRGTLSEDVHPVGTGRSSE